jgi:hypothetical protein
VSPVSIISSNAEEPASPSNLKLKSLLAPTDGNPPTPSGNDGLLSGMTPSKYSIPSGWTLIKTQDFEGTNLTSSEFLTGAKFTTNLVHSGSKSVSGTYSGDSSEVKYGLYEGNTGSFNEVYISAWIFDESQGRFNDENFFVRVLKTDTNGNLAQELMGMTFGLGSSTEDSGFNSISAKAIISGASTENGVTETWWGRTLTGGWGNWTQWEFWYRPNAPGSSNGFARLYQNGTLIHKVENANINGSVNMSNSMLQIGGVYTKLTWLHSNGACSSFIGEGGDNGPRVSNWNETCPCPNQCPPDGKVPIFKRYIDDVIFMKR